MFHPPPLAVEWVATEAAHQPPPNPKSELTQRDVLVHPVFRQNHLLFPYRFTIYTSKGKKYGPFGDRRSEESVDFDVSAPPGHALAYISGTVDFGVPLRSVSLHWRPYPG